MGKKARYYVVWKGRRPGVFRTWKECSEQVTGFPGAVYKGFPSLRDAETALASELAPKQRPPRRSPARSRPPPPAEPIPDSYTVDASCIGPPGPVEYRGVETRTGREVFRQGPFANGTNNIAEFLAIVHALALLHGRGLSMPIYSDSQIAIGWVRRKKCRTKHVRDETNSELFELIDRAEAWLRGNEYDNQLLKWETTVWGENPADFGRKIEFQN
jgi:ribonuclease HI